jgi:hypothetical protein
MSKNVLLKQKDANNHYGFGMVSVFIKVISAMLGVGILSLTSYGFVFYSAAMLPSVITIFVDRHPQRCASATICAFNLIGVLPYLVQIWTHDNVDHVIKSLTGDIKTWIIVYGSSLIGQMVYWCVPYLTVKLYITKASVQSTLIASERDKICADWGIRSDDPYRGIFDDEFRK